MSEETDVEIIEEAPLEEEILEEEILEGEAPAPIVTAAQNIIDILTRQSDAAETPYTPFVTSRERLR